MALRVLLLRKKLTDQQTALRALERAAEGCRPGGGAGRRH